MATGRTYYAWAPITIADVTGIKPFITIPVGDKVTKTQVGDDWPDLVSSGAIRIKPYPKNVRSDESPKNATLRALNEAQKRALAPFMDEDNPDLTDLDEEVLLYSSGKE